MEEKEGEETGEKRGGKRRGKEDVAHLFGGYKNRW